MFGLVASFCPPDPNRPRIRFPIPLKSVDVSAFVVDATARVIVRQTYENSIAASIRPGTDDRQIIVRPGTATEPPKTLECAYNFPIDPSAAVLGLRVVIGNTEIKTEVRAKKEARETYEKATAAGMKTTLLEQDEPDVATIYVGNLAPKEKAVVELTYVTELATTEIDGIGFSAVGKRALRFVLPTTIAPRYGARPTEGRPIVDFSIVPEAAVDYRLTFDATIRMSLGIDSVISPSHPNLMFLPKRDAPGAVPAGKTPLEVTVRGESVPLVKDLVVAIVPASEKPATSCVSWSERFGELAVANAFSPLPSAIGRRKATADEFVLVLDRSGSMAGEKLQTAKDAVSLFVTALPSECKFSLVTFSNDAETFSQMLLSPEAAIVDRAKKWIAAIDANGGTNTAKGVKLADEILRGSGSRDPDDPTKPRRSIFVVTDGEFYDREECGEKIRTALKAGIRTFALGIGDAVSRGTLEFMANAGDGTYDTAMIHESVVAKVMGMLGRMRGTIVKDVRVSVTPPSEWRVAFSTSKPSGTGFVGTANIAYTIIAPETNGTKSSARSLLTSGGAGAKLPIEISYRDPDDPSPTKRVAFRGDPDIKRLLESYDRAVAEKSATGWMSGTVSVDLVETTVGDKFSDEAETSVADGWMHALAAHKRAVWLTESLTAEGVDVDATKNTIRDLGTKYGVLTSETSFVGVGATLPPPGKSGPPTKVLIPISIATGEVFFFGKGGGTMLRGYAPMAASGTRAMTEKAVQERATSAPVTRERALVAFLLKQNADGSWSPDANADLAKRVDAVLAAMKPKSEVEFWKKMIATSIVVWSFPTTHADMIEVWRRSSGKARIYLASHSDAWDAINNFAKSGLLTTFTNFEVTG